MSPLDGIKVLDLSRVLAAPTCTQTLGDLGAEVWKIEAPEGDDTRSWTPPDLAGESTYYLSANRNKKSVIVNLKSPEGQEIVRQLMTHADVLVENMKTGTLERFGLGWEHARKINPRLIYCSVSGYGRESPLKDRPGYDLVIQAESGLMSITGLPDGEPMKHGMAITDLVTGMASVQAILAALIARATTGKGQHLDMALYDCAVATLANIGSSYLNAGLVAGRAGNAHPTIVPYQSFPTSNGAVVVAVGNDGQYRKLCGEVLERPDLGTDPRFLKNHDRVVNRKVLVPLIAARFRDKTTEEWVPRLVAAGIPNGQVRNVGQVFTAPEALERGLVTRAPHPTGGEVTMIASPLRLSDTPVRAPVAPPLLGQHTEEVLREVLGADKARIDGWVAAGAVALGKGA